MSALLRTRPEQVGARRAVSQRSRRSIRLQGYDYTLAGAYFITICTWNQECLFGDMRLNAAGRAVADKWIKIGVIRHAIDLDEWVVMPNHFHGIVVIAGGGDPARDRGTARRCPYGGKQFGQPVSGSIPTIVRSFKSAATKRINELRDTPGAKLWQRNYWEHIIRNESELHRIREYIRNNPAQWEFDRLYRQGAR